jgi:hypothetical protein
MGIPISAFCKVNPSSEKNGGTKTINIYIINPHEIPC